MIAMQGKPGILSVLDIGDTKVVCFIAQVDHEGKMRIIGIGHQVARGMKGGVLTDIGEAEASIVAAVHAAEQMAGETIEEVIVNLSGTNVTSRNISVEMELSGSSVTERDIADLIDEGGHSVLTEKTEIIHCIPISYFLDDDRGIKDPRGLFGKVLGVELHIVLASSALLRNIAACVGRCHLNVSRYVVSSFASGLACLAPDEKELGVTLIDMGGGVTSVSVFVGGKLLYTDSVPIGGLHVTNDIAKGLSTSLADAERIKTLHGSVQVSPTDSQLMIEVPQLGEADEDAEGITIPRAMLVNIIRPRLEEIFEMVRGRLEGSQMDRVAGRRVVLTGGACQLFGIKDLAGQVLSRQVRVARPQDISGLADAVSGTAFSTPIGMLLAASMMPQSEDAFEPRRGGGASGSLGHRILRWFKDNF